MPTADPSTAAARELCQALQSCMFSSATLRMWRPFGDLFMDMAPLVVRAPSHWLTPPHPLYPLPCRVLG